MDGQSDVTLGDTFTVLKSDDYSQIWKDSSGQDVGFIWIDDGNEIQLGTSGDYDLDLYRGCSGTLSP